MSYVARLQSELSLKPGEVPKEFMLRYLEQSQAMPGVAIQKWAADVVEAAQMVGHGMTPLAVESLKVSKYQVERIAEFTLAQTRDPKQKIAEELSDAKIYMSVAFANLQLALDAMRATSPEMVEGIPNIDAMRLTGTIASDASAALARYDALKTEEYKRRGL